MVVQVPPLTSIKYAGVPWELGLSEDQTLLLNACVTCSITQMATKTPSVAIAAMLGAEERVFNRLHHYRLRDDAQVSPEYLSEECYKDPRCVKFVGQLSMSFFFFMVAEVREIMAMWIPFI